MTIPSGDISRSPASATLRPAGRKTSPHIARVAIALGCAFAGLATTEIIFRATGEFVTALLIVPVFVATWYGGLASGVLTVAIQTAVSAALREPALSLYVASTADRVRLIVASAMSVAAVWMVIRARRIERYFRTVVDIALEGIWVVDAAGRTTFVNPRMAEMLGYTSEELYGRRFSDFVPPDTLSGLESAFQGLRAGVRSWNDIQLVRKDGSLVWVHYAATPIREGSAFTGSMAVVTDISRRKRDEETIRRQAEELQRADAKKDQFLAMLGHELRNPLGPIITALRLMELKGDVSFQQERTIIGRQAAQLSRLVDDLSDVSRIMRGNIPMRKETVNIVEVIERARETVTPLLFRKGHSLELDTPSRLTVEGDGARLEQVLVNLLTNAAKYTPPGGRIVIRGEHDGESVTIRVRDNGLGISPDFLPRLFEPFAQKPQAVAFSEGGLGLGLAIVRAIVKAHGGTIDCHSEGEGRGSEFVVRLPVRSSAALPAPQGEHDAQPSETNVQAM
jgi:PAS domain S-box-containing protein